VKKIFEKKEGVLKKINESFPLKKEHNHIKSGTSGILYAIIFALIFCIFLYSPINIATTAMEPELLRGDFILASKFSYGYSKYSFPIKMPIKGRIFESLPKRGDVVVFRVPRNGIGIHRLVGLPGDKVQMKDGILYLNNKAIPREFIKIQEDDDKKQIAGEYRKVALRYLETLPEGKAYEMLDAMEGGIVDTTGAYIVPKGYYFVIGDNRDESLDSRFKSVGFISLEQIIGKPHFVLISLEENTFKFWKWPFVIKWSRFFRIIK